MANLKAIKNTIETTQTIKDIAAALGDIATMKVKATRKTIEQNVKFFHEVSEVYKVVKSAAAKKGLEGKITRKRNSKTVCIMLTANGKFYGNLDAELTHFFVQVTSKMECDRIIVGFAGKDLIGLYDYPYKFENIIFKKNTPSFEELKSLTDKVFGYSRILTFHSKFVTLLNQVPAITDVSATSQEEKPETKENSFYILEPELEKMIVFFESQISFLIFQSIFAEVDIARLAARMVSMNEAEINAGKMLDSQVKEMLKIRKQKINQQSVEIFGNLANT